MRFTYKPVFRLGEGGYTEYRIPGIVGHRGEAVMCIEARSSSTSDWGRIDIMILGEEGCRHKFVPMGSAPKAGETAVPRPGDTLNNPTLISDGDRLHLIFHVNYMYALYSFSDDSGRTWSPIRDITETYRGFDYDWNVCATGPGHGIKLENGRLVAPIWLANGEVEHGEFYSVKHYPSIAGAVYSDDGGITWHAGATFRDVGNVMDCNETTCAQLSDGSVLFNIRHRGEVRCRALGISTDGGASCFWMQQDMSLEDPRCFGSMVRVGEEVYFTNCRSTNGRVDLGVKRLTNGGWEKCGLIDKVGGYSDCADIGGKLWVLYERTTDDCISEVVLAKEI